MQEPAQILLNQFRSSPFGFTACLETEDETNRAFIRMSAWTGLDPIDVQTALLELLEQELVQEDRVFGRFVKWTAK